MDINKTCPYCGNLVNVKAVMCPKCGVALTHLPKKKNGMSTGGVVAIIIVACVFVAGFIGSTIDKNKPDSDNVVANNTEEPTSTEDELDNADSNTLAESKPTAEPDPTPETTKKPISKKKYMGKCKEYKYKKLMRNPDDYLDKKIKITGEIQQVQVQTVLFGDDATYYRVSTKQLYGAYPDDDYVIYDKRDNSDGLKLLEGDIVTIYGTFSGVQTLESALLSTDMERPSIDMRYVKLINE